MSNHAPTSARVYLSDTFHLRRFSSLLWMLFGLVMTPFGAIMVGLLIGEILAGGFWDSPWQAAKLILLSLGFFLFNTLPGCWMVFRFVKALVSNERRDIRIDEMGIHQGPVTIPWSNVDWLGYSQSPFSRHVNLLYKEFSRHDYPALLYMDHRLTTDQCHELMATLEQELEPIYPDILFGVQRPWSRSYLSHATLGAK